MKPLTVFVLISAHGTLSAAAAQVPCEVLHLVDPVPDENGVVGKGVAIQGDRMAVAIHSTNPASSGRVMVFERAPHGWTHATDLVPSDGLDVDGFGAALGMDGDRIVVGSLNHPPSGQAYVFEKLPSGWRETGILTHPAAHGIGKSVAIDGDLVAVGCYGDSGKTGGGSVLVFEWNGSSWELDEMIQPSLGAPADQFGFSVAIDGTQVLAGARNAGGSQKGRAYLFERLGTTFTIWNEEAIFEPPGLVLGDNFGYAVALDGDRAVVTSIGQDGLAVNTGAAFVFEDTGSGWVQTAKLDSSSTAPLANMGSSVDLQGDRILLGAPSDGAELYVSGSASLYCYDGSSWYEAARFEGSDPIEKGAFGFSVSIDDDELLIGSPTLNAPDPLPRAYLFRLGGGPSLLSTAGEVSLSAGGAQPLQLGACASHAGDVVVLAGSASGTSPGFAIGGVPIPLQPDDYLALTIASLGGPPLPGSVGLLDAWGRAEAAFALPPGLPPSLAGLTLHHAYAVLDPATLAPLAASPALPVALVP